VSLDQYFLLGRSGLRVSRLALGAMTFGTHWGWGADESVSRAMFDRYVAAGGNFFDTANAYTNGDSERMLGRFIRESGMRDRAVITTKFTFGDSDGGPSANTGGNHRKNIMRSIDASLRRLSTDYIDLYLMHFWDQLTSVEEVMRTFDDLVRGGKVRYIGFSNVPAWYVGRAQTLAEWRGWERIAALQMQYSLVERNIEYEYTTLAQELGIGIMAWSPLASGFLSGKYRPSEDGGSGEGRLQVMKATNNLGMGRFGERNWAILTKLEEVAKKAGRSMSQIALHWAANRPGIDSLIIGATRIEQLEDNLAALDFELAPELVAELDQVSAQPLPYPYSFFEPVMQGRQYGGASVGDKPAGYRRGVYIPGAPAKR
jgi:aryl-alcohol dehydrogenase-like predicted oxidoreductase